MIGQRDHTESLDCNWQRDGKLLRLLNRIRSALRDGWHDPVTHYGANYQGRFEIKGSQVFGVVTHQSDISWREPKSVVLLRDQQEVASTCSFEAAGHSWRFTIDTDREFAADDILKERLEVFAVDRLGGRSRLRMEGAMQLGYIREVFGAPSALELSIDFSRKGNGRDYVRDGWYGPEEEHTWTRGTYSTIELPFRVPGSKYELEILAWPFVVPGKIGSQSLVISIAGCGITRSFVKPGRNYLRYEIPPDLITDHTVLIRLDHADAARPCDFGLARDNRVIALAFRALKLRRQITDQASQTDTEEQASATRCSDIRDLS